MIYASVKFSEIEHDLNTGDIILFHGTTSFEEVIQIGENTEWSHVAMVVLPEDIGMHSCTGDILLWESSSVEYFDYETQTLKSGPHLIRLKELLSALTNLSKKRYFSIRYLDCDRNEEFKSNLIDFITSKKVEKASFPKYKDIIVEFIEGHFEHKKGPNDTYFCSELIADTYINIGILTSKFPASYYSPKDFSSTNNIGLLKRSFLREEILIDYDY